MLLSTKPHFMNVSLNWRWEQESEWIIWVKSVSIMVTFCLFHNIVHGASTVITCIIAKFIIFVMFLGISFISTLIISINKKTLCAVTIAIICSNLASCWKFLYFRRPIYNPVEHLTEYEKSLILNNFDHQ